MKFSPQGKYFAWSNGINLKVCSTNDWSVVAVISRPKVLDIQFSPKDSYIMTYEMYAVNKDHPQGFSNLNIYASATGSLLMSLVQKKQTGWEPEWADDESILTFMAGGEGMIYAIDPAQATWDTKPTHKLGGGRGGKLGVAPGSSPFHLAYYVPGTQGQPSTCRIFQYPKIQSNEAVASKSFFQADRVDYMWNNRGTNLLLMTSTEVDATGASYYGKQALHHMTIKGDTTLIQLSKDGPIHDVAWSPKNVEFCIIYGFMPAKATLFNIKCEPVFEFGTGPKNSIYYNHLGNLLLLAGFGNLRGRVEVWDAQARKQLGTTDASDTTLLEWGPSGEVFLTATTAPRLRMSNGFKVWHYSCILLHETSWPTGEELLGACWQKFPKGVFKEKVLKANIVQGIEPSQPKASTQAYRPPSARGKINTFNLHDDDEPIAVTEKKTTLSKATLKQKKKREAKKIRKAIEEKDEPSAQSPVEHTAKVATVSLEGIEDPEIATKMKAIKRKLDAIEKIKVLKAEGKPLHINQIAKMNSEKSLLQELEALKV